MIAGLANCQKLCPGSGLRRLAVCIVRSKVNILCLVSQILRGKREGTNVFMLHEVGIFGVHLIRRGIRYEPAGLEGLCALQGRSAAS